MHRVKTRASIAAIALLGCLGSAVEGTAVRQARAAGHVSPSQAVASPAAPPVHYDFKGVPLGISLTDFRKLPHPDGYPAVVVCTGETVTANGYSSEPSGVGVYDEARKRAGITQCVWVLTDATNPYAYGKTVGLKVGGSEYATNDYTFVFIPDPSDGVSKLFRYAGITNRNAFDPVVAALTAKYGAPKNGAGTVQNGMGNTFQQTTATWSNSLGSIEVTAPAQSVTMMSIVVIDRRLDAAADAAVQKQRGSSPNPI